MANFNGQLSIIGNQSNLDDGITDFLLVMANDTDPAHAIFSATQFLVKVRKLQSGQMINVIGTSHSNPMSIIAMTDASAAGPEAALAAGFESVAVGGAAKAGGKKKSEKRGTKKKKSAKGSKKSRKK